LGFPAGRGSQLPATDAGREPHAAGTHMFLQGLFHLSPLWIPAF
jgi:hypothetical protein